MFNSKNIFLYPVSLIYGLITDLRNLFYDKGFFKSEKFNIPIICVGNITIGGTGKTPHTEYLISLLKEDFNVVVLSRGYKRKSSGFIVANSSSTVSDIGDEPLQIKRKFPNILVVVDRDRVNGVKKILKLKPETDVIILDDGFQHRSLIPGFSILLSDYNRPMLSDKLIPYGSLRESIKNLKRADLIIITKAPADLTSEGKEQIINQLNRSGQKIFFTTLTYKKPLPVFGESPEKANFEIIPTSDAGIVLVTGIANPTPLADHLLKNFNEVIHIPFPDHHVFSENDILSVSSAFKKLQSPIKYIITTEKDAMRFKEFTKFAQEFKKAFYYIPASIDFLNNDMDEFNNLITDYVRKNKGNN